MERLPLPSSHWPQPLAPLGGVVWLLCLVTLATAGCLGQTRVQLPQEDLLTRGQLRIHHDFELPSEHRLVSELAELRGDILTRLELPSSDEPIHVYLFEDHDQFGTYVSSHFPEFPARRAFFTRSDTTLSVYAYWGDQVGDDLRHETTHAYLHSVVPQLPLWLDEGLAEYFELPRGSHGFHREHLRYLARRRMEGEWVPNLERLEQIASSGQMRQADYAEAWLWTHFLLNSSPELSAWTRGRLFEMRRSGDSPLWAGDVESLTGGSRAAAETHLAALLRLDDEPAQ